MSSMFLIEGTFQGGIAGTPRVQWFRVDGDGNAEELPETTPDKFGNADDVGKTLRVVYTPVRWWLWWLWFVVFVVRVRAG